MNFKTENINNNVIFTIMENSIEGKSAAELKSRILIAAQPDIDSFVMDMSFVNVIDSSGLGALLLAHRQLKDYKIPVVLVGLNPFVKNLLAITHISDIFQYGKTVEDAINLISR